MTISNDLQFREFLFREQKTVTVTDCCITLTTVTITADPVILVYSATHGPWLMLWVKIRIFLDWNQIVRLKIARFPNS